jgi:hypothetical protein
MLEQACGVELPVRYLARDLDFKYSKRFDQLFADNGVSIEPPASRAPNHNAFIERWIGSVHGECLNRFIVFSFGHLDHFVSCYCEYYHRARPHQWKENSRCSAPGPRSTIRRTTVERSSVARGSAACSGTTNVRPHDELHGHASVPHRVQARSRSFASDRSTAICDNQATPITSRDPISAGNSQSILSDKLVKQDSHCSMRPATNVDLLQCGPLCRLRR